MKLVGQTIKHKVFGTGIVSNKDDHILTICFPIGEKQFIYPDAFSKFLVLRDGNMQNEIQNLLYEKNAEKRAQQQIIQDEQERRKLLRSLKITPNSQAVFNLNNDDINDTFSSWTISTGCYLSGDSKGKPRTPHRLKPNSLCLLTHCGEDTIEQERRIIGAFMVEEDFFGKVCRDGVIKAHETYRIRLSSDNEVLFWPYLEENPPEKPWGNVAFKYFNNVIARKILFDIKEALQDSSDSELMKEFYEYFCKINHIN